MLITPDNLQFLFQTFLARYQAAYQQAQQWWSMYATEMPSTTETNIYGWLAELGGLTKRQGERKVDDVAARSYSLTNDDYQKTVGLALNKVKDDSYGLFAPTIDLLGQQAKWWPDDLCTATLLANPVCFDGQPFFDDSHPVDMDDASAGTYQNLFDAGHGGALDLNLDNYATIRAAMMKYRGEARRPMNLIGNLLMVPPDLEKKALQVANAQLVAQNIVQGGGNTAAGVSNVYQGSCTVLVNGRLTDPKSYYLMCTTRPIKPIIFQQREAPVFTIMDQPTSENVYRKKEIEYAVDARGAAGVSFPFLAIKATTP